MSADGAVRPHHPARAIFRASGLLAAALVVAAAVQGSGPGTSFAADLPWMALFAISAAALVFLGAMVLDRAFLGAGITAEVARDNVAAALVASSHRVAVAAVASRCLFGADLGTLAIGAVFVALGVATLLVFQILHRRLTHYADDQEIKGQNVAVALSSAGLILALAVIVGHATEGSFHGWGASLRAYCLALLLACGLYPVRQVLVARLILGLPLGLRGRALDRAIMEERDEICGAVEGLAYLATAFLVTGLW
jgi:uncharacterized membrane protein YjfL (UPF0719 family)